MTELPTNSYQTLIAKPMTDTFRDYRMDQSINTVKETVMNNKGLFVGATVAGIVYVNKERKRLNFDWVQI